MDLFGPKVLTVKIVKPNGSIGLKAGESKGGGNAYPLVKNLVEGSIAHNNEEFTIGNSISAVNGVSMKGKKGHDVHEMVRNAAIGDTLVFEIIPMGGGSKMSKQGSLGSLGAMSMNSFSSMGGGESGSGRAFDDEDEDEDGFGDANAGQFRRRSSLGDLNLDMFGSGDAGGGGVTIEEE